MNFSNFDVIEKFDTLNAIRNSDSNVSSFLTIQEGCDKFCKFCVVPYTKEDLNSQDLSMNLLQRNKELVNNGAKEIILLGQNVNAFNYKGKKLADLINEISQIKKIERIRYTTSHPIDFTKDLIEIHKVSKKLKKIHLPVQMDQIKF